MGSGHSNALVTSYLVRSPQSPDFKLHLLQNHVKVQSARGTNFAVMGTNWLMRFPMSSTYLDNSACLQNSFSAYNGFVGEVSTSSFIPLKQTSTYADQKNKGLKSQE